MASKPQQSKGRDGLLSTLDVLIQALSVAKDACSAIPPAKIAIASASVLLTMIRVCFPYPATRFRLTFIQDTVANKEGYVSLGVCCGEVCQALGRGLKGRQLEELSESVLQAIEQLTT